MSNLRAILLLFVANTISSIAQGLSMIAIPWYFALQAEMGKYGLVYILATTVSLIWVPYAGTFVDKYDRKHVFLVINLICGCIIGGIAWYGHSMAGLPWWVVAAVFVITFFNYNIHYPNLYAFVQEITEEKNYGKITSFLEIQGQLSTMMAGAAGALLLEGTSTKSENYLGRQLGKLIETEAWTIYEIFTLDAITYFISFLIITLISYRSLKTRTYEPGSPLERVKVGIQFLKKQPYILIFGIFSYSVFAVVLIEGFYVGAIYVKNHLQSAGDVYAISEVFYALGALLAGIAVQRIFRSLTRVQSVIILTFLTCFVTAWLAVSKSDAVFYAVLFLVGWANAGVRILRVNYLFLRVPTQVYGRVNSVFYIFNALARITFVSLFTLAFFQTENNVIWAMAILAIFLLISGIVLIKYYHQITNVKVINI